MSRQVTCRTCTNDDHLLDDKALQHELAVGTLQEAALHTVGCGQAEHQHRPGLPYPVSPVHGLRASYTISQHSYSQGVSLCIDTADSDLLGEPNLSPPGCHSVYFESLA